MSVTAVATGEGVAFGSLIISFAVVGGTVVVALVVSVRSSAVVSLLSPALSSIASSSVQFPVEFIPSRSLSRSVALVSFPSAAPLAASLLLSDFKPSPSPRDTASAAARTPPPMSHFFLFPPVCFSSSSGSGGGGGGGTKSSSLR